MFWDFVFEIAIMTIGVSIGGFLIENRFRIWHRAFARLGIVKPIFKWIIAVLVTGSVGGIFRVITENAISHLGGNELMVDIGGNFVFGIFLGIIVMSSFDLPSENKK